MPSPSPISGLNPITSLPVGSLIEVAEKSGSSYVSKMMAQEDFFGSSNDRILIVNVMDFMTQAEKDDVVAGTLSVDVTSAVQSAIAVVAAQGHGVLVFPAGSYLLSARLNVSLAGVLVILGAGSGLAKLMWTDPSTNNGGFNITYTDYFKPPVIRGFTLMTRAGKGVGTALKITGPDAGSVTFFGPDVQDVVIEGESATLDGWEYGIDFVQCWYPYWERLNIKGTNDTVYPFGTVAAIRLQDCQVPRGRMFNIFYAQGGVVEASSGGTPHGEGINLSNFEIVGVDNGIDYQVNSAGPATSINNGHINAYKVGIKLANQVQTSLHDLHIQKVGVSIFDFIGINLFDCVLCNIHDNYINGWQPTSGEATGIVVTGSTGSTGNHIHHNRFDYFSGTGKVGIIVNNNSGDNHFEYNTKTSTVNTVLQFDASAAKTNTCFRNLPMAAQGFADLDTTPSVGNAFNELFFANNSGATTITALDDGWIGQEVKLLSLNGNTTLQHGSNLILRGATNYTLAANEQITLECWDTNVWRERSRSA